MITKEPLFSPLCHCEPERVSVQAWQSIFYIIGFASFFFEIRDCHASLREARNDRGEEKYKIASPPSAGSQYNEGICHCEKRGDKAIPQNIEFL